MRTELFRLLRNLIALAAISIISFFIYQYFNKDVDDQLHIDETPIHIESIKTIAEISTVSYKDEVVMDSVEYYNSSNDYYDKIMRYYDKNVKRRLTLIIHGELKYGINLTNGNYNSESNQDTIWLHLPEPILLDVIMSPSKTEVFEELGTWDDGTRKEMEMHAKSKLKENGELLKLNDKARLNTIRLFNKLIKTEKKLIIDFNYEK